MRPPRADPNGSGEATRERPDRPPFTVVLPVFDEEEGVIATLDALQRVLQGSANTYELLVVDDGSTDATARILAARSDVTVLRHPDNRGYGAALKTGIRGARHPLVVVMDADGTYAAGAVPALVDACADVDMVVGARIGRNVSSAKLRSVVKWCFRQFAQWMTRTRIPDLNSGLRVFHRPLAERFMGVLPNGFSFTTTITVASILERRAVRFEVVDYLPRIGRSKLHPLRDTLRIARQLLRLGMVFAPFRTTVPLACALALAFIASAARHMVTVHRVFTCDVAWLVAAAVTLAVGVRAEQRVRRRRSLAELVRS